MRRFSLLFSMLLFASLSPNISRAQNSLSGFNLQNAKPALLDPGSLAIGPDQDAACKSSYGIGIFDGDQKVASFRPQGTNDIECDISRIAQEKALLTMIAKAKIANKDPAAKSKQYLLLADGKIEVIEVKKDTPSALEKKVAELEAHIRHLQHESSDEFRERAKAKLHRSSSH